MECESCGCPAFVVLPTVLIVWSRSFQTIVCLLSVSMLSTEPSVQPLPCSLCRRRSSRQPLEGEFPMQGKKDSLWSRKTYTPTLARPLQCCVTLGNELHFCEPASSAGNLRWQQTITVPMHQALMHEGQVHPTASNTWDFLPKSLLSATKWQAGSAGN